MPSPSGKTDPVPKAVQDSLDTEYRGSIIPPSKSWRTLALCFDGTGDQFDCDNSNVVQLFSMLKKGDASQQMVYYQAGIGTYTIPQIATPLYTTFSKTVDMMLASNLNHHVMAGYGFLMQNYREGDKICIFGFSRGAYTARALAGMVHKVGLLPVDNHQQVPFAYRMFMQDDDEGWRESILFKKTFSIDVDIDFLGVWETVASVGIFPRHLPFTKSNTSIRTFRHALALDEHRVKFRPSLHQRTSAAEAHRADAARLARGRHGAGGRKGGGAKEDLEEPTKVLDQVKGAVKKKESDEREKKALEAAYSGGRDDTDVLEVWFVGCHCDIGGGNVKNGTRHSLARIPLRWMVRQCFLARTGIQFEADLLRDIGINPDTLYPEVRKRPPALPPPHTLPSAKEMGEEDVESEDEEGDQGEGEESDEDEDEGQAMNEEEEDAKDALCSAFDQLAISKAWWTLELLPMRDPMGSGALRPNLGNARTLRKQREDGVRVHRSVKTRMDTPQLHYKPLLQFDVEPTWVD